MEMEEEYSISGGSDGGSTQYAIGRAKKILIENAEAEEEADLKNLTVEEMQAENQ